MNIYVTVVGTKHYYGPGIFKVGMRLNLTKDLENEYDDEAIKAEIPGVSTVGYVANSVYSVAKGTRSAGRVYDAFDHETTGVVEFIVGDKVIVRLEKAARNETAEVEA